MKSIKGVPKVKRRGDHRGARHRQQRSKYEAQLGGAMMTQSLCRIQRRQTLAALETDEYDLGYFDDETCRLEPIENPFSPKVLPMSPE